MSAWAAPSALADVPAKPVVDPTAIAAIAKMSAFLRTQQSFEVTSEATTDAVLDSGQKVQFGGVVDFKVRRPNRLFADVATDRKNERLYYDGNIFTAFQPKLGLYASFAAPPTIRELLDVLEQRYGVDVPLADVFRLGSDETLAAIKTATSVGLSTVKGVPCSHYAFHQPDVDWEIWIQEGAQPLPRKFVITTTSERAQPQHVAVLTWNLGATFEDGAFAFNPPANAHRIDFDVAAPAVMPPQRQGRAAPRHGGTP